MIKLECFFDCSSPWTYLGFHNLQPIAARHGLEILWRPIIVGGVFNAVNMPVYADRANPPVPRKAAYHLKDMQDWARWSGITINFPPRCGHPVNAVKCMRGCIVMQDEGRMVPFARAAFEALWHDGLDLARDDVLVDLCRRAGGDPERFLAAIATPAVKARLRANTDELIERQGFGSPTVFVDDTDMYFGNDRMVLVEAAIRRRLDPACVPAR
ncbi:MAG: 2-hydroxychromene-2-carboxylate isomerase [Gammaproteobacteria bacterium]